MNADELITTIRFYLRRDTHLKRAGAQPLSAQPEWVQTVLWAYSARAATRYARLLAAQRVPVPVQRKK